MRRTLAAAASTALVLGLGIGLGLAPALAGAGTTRAASTVTVTSAIVVEDGTSIRGRVASDDADCKKGRRVRVYHDVAPPGPSAKDFLLGTVTSSNRGRWRLATAYYPDKVYAKVVGTDDCKKDTSPTVAVTP